jgi:WD40 repeat protein
MARIFLLFSSKNKSFVSKLGSDLSNAGHFVLNSELKENDQIEWQQAEVVILCLSPQLIEDGTKRRLINEIKTSKKIVSIMIRDCYQKLRDFEETSWVIKLKTIPFEENYENSLSKLLDNLRSEIDPGSISLGWRAKEYKEDLSYARAREKFYGYEEELDALERYVLEEHSRVVAITGLPGIGKTALTLELIENIKRNFDFVIWRPINNAPPISEILNDWMNFLVGHELPPNESDVNSVISVLLEFLKEERCLLILDNLETILEKKTIAGKFEKDYRTYESLIQRIGEVSHRSCLLLTSREKPAVVVRLESETSFVKSKTLPGLSIKAGKRLFEDKKLIGSAKDKEDLVRHYSGNPLSLKITMDTIVDPYRRNIGDFLREGAPVFGNMREELTNHVDRLSQSEQEIMYWLATKREFTSIEEIRTLLLSRPSRARLIEDLKYLAENRSLIDAGKSATYSLQPVIMEYVTDRLVEKVSAEIISGDIDLINRVSLMHAEAKDYVREIQIRLIIDPIIERLYANWDKRGIELQLLELIKLSQDSHGRAPGYIAGNIINLLCQLDRNLEKMNFSNLSIWQADLQDKSLIDVNFVNCDFKETVFSRIFDRIPTIAFSPNGDLLAAGTAGGEIHIWQTQSNIQLRVFKGHKNWIRCVTFSPNGKLLASGGGDHTVRIWDITTGQCIKTLIGHKNWVREVTFSPDGTKIASSSDDGTIKIWNTKNWSLERSLTGHTDWVGSVAFSPDGLQLASGSHDHSVRIWDVSSGDCLGILSGHGERVWSVVFSPDGKLLASGSADQTIKIWNLTDWENIRTLVGHTNWVWSVAFHSGGKWLASASNDHTIRIWDVETGETIKTFLGHTSWVLSVKFSPDGKLLASGGADQTVRIWDVYSGRSITTISGHIHSIPSVVFSSNDDLLMSSSDDETVKLWDLKDNKCIKVLSGHGSRVSYATFSPDGQRIASCSEDETIKLWDVTTGECLRTFYGHENWVLNVLFFKDQSRLLSSGDDQTVRIWNLSTGECINILRGHTNWVPAISLSPDNKKIASGSADRTIRIWDAESGKPLSVLSGHMNRIWSVAFSPSGDLIASGSEDMTAKIWEPNTGREIKTLIGHEGQLRSVAFSSNGKLLASGGHDNIVIIWDIESGKELHRLTGHTDWVRTVSFSSNGNLLASSGNDGTIRLWETNSGKCVEVLISDRLYERMNIKGATGLTEAQIATLRDLGAIGI